MSDTDGFDFERHLTNMFEPSNTAERLHSERVAGRTPKQRARSKGRTEGIGCRATKDTLDLLRRLAEHQGASQADIIEDALRLMAQKLGVPEVVS